MTKFTRTTRISLGSAVVLTASLMLGGTAAAANTTVNTTHGCAETQSPAITTTRGTPALNVAQNHTWSRAGVAAQNSSTTGITLSSAFVGQSQGNFFGSSASGISITARQCVMRIA